MKRIKLVLGIVALFIIATGNIAFAQEDNNLLKGWTNLGSRVVDYTLDHDVVSLNNSKEVFTSLRVTVKGGALNMHKATVHFANGDKQDIDFPEVATAENTGRVIDLKGNNRVIEKVTFWYDTKGNSANKATVEVWGKKA
ncbi:MAG TPA: hypothetical protein VFE50_20835 [Cyclobacteriaceae bacterium]|nr:hypothetical protein [Cyclobacteriaceae bacterium]